MDASIAVEVFNGSDPMGKLNIRAESLPKVTDALSAMLSRRKTPCSGGMGYKELRS